MKQFLKNIFRIKTIKRQSLPKFGKLLEKLEGDLNKFRAKNFSSFEEEKKAFKIKNSVRFDFLM